ncbi:magnesium transporter [Mycena crocata]|nr:magnesium transporter [Mycena crocata]
MPRENSFSDSDGRSLTPDLEDEDEVNSFPPKSPTYAPPSPNLYTTRTRESALSKVSRTRRPVPYPTERFRRVVRKVIAMHRGTAVMSRRGVGAEPGVDPRNASADAEFGQIHQECVIEVADYSSVRASFGRMTNCDFVDFMNDSAASKREAWVKVRWINIAGMSWDAIKAVSIKYDLHPLALDDVFRTQSTKARSKADYYSRHLFLRILCHELVGEVPHNAFRGVPRSARPIPSATPPVDSETTLRNSMRRRRTGTADTGHQYPPASEFGDLPPTDDVEERRRIQEAALSVLKRGERVNVKVSPMFIFLFRDGTVITIHSTPSLEMTQPITNRLRQFDTGLRTSSDASLLVQSLLSLVADKALQVVNAYQDKIKKFERQIMLRPSIDTVRNLHILSADLILHRRTLEPLKSVVAGLRRYDLDRAAATVEHNDGKVVGFMTHKTLIYLADVYDHVEYVLSQLDVIAGIGQNLVDYTFNLTSYEMNEVMRRLMIVTVIFLPLTLLCGYFGMNFDQPWLITQRSDSMYWILAIPIMVVVVPLFIIPDIERMIHYVQKKTLTKNILKSFKLT